MGMGLKGRRDNIF